MSDWNALFITEAQFIAHCDAANFYNSNGLYPNCASASTKDASSYLSSSAINYIVSLRAKTETEDFATSTPTYDPVTIVDNNRDSPALLKVWPPSPLAVPDYLP
ncbi:hypothetical protein KIPB_011085 [Kipferlia bialata]|uniref:Uncharacterized protein n=1 Tax=Kipferlia bialata TaxID=797122 RepID=A0A9K3D5K1_9EUKA|nr:hypothetical protein KIPB_011085 [Kipferlia bialata]|eukprot:g11085.t1